MNNPKKPNEKLRHQRKLRSWTLQDVASKLYDLCEQANEQESERGIISEKTVGSWERGEHSPSPFWQKKLNALFGKNAVELGFIEPLEMSTSSHVSTPPPLSSVQTAASNLPTNTIDSLHPENRETVVPVASDLQSAMPTLFTRLYQTVDHLFEATSGTPEELAEAWLALGAYHLVPLFEEGWSVEEVFSSLHIVLKVVQAMPKILQQLSRRKVLKLSVAAVLGGIPLLTGEHVSVEERTRLHHAFEESIAAGWKLFHTAGTAQVLAVGRAHLFLVKQSSSYLYPTIRPLYYSSVYNLIGAALHFQGHYDEAHQAHEQAYLAALEGADGWNMAQSRTMQANGLREQERYPEALQTIEAALRLVSQQSDTASIRLRAHLLASGAENAALLGETTLAEKQLDASRALLEQLPLTSTEEFDHASWHQYAGACALILKHDDHAIEELQRALDTLPPHWIVRHVTALMPLAIAYARKRERDRCLETAKKAAQVVKIMNAPSLNRQFMAYLEQEVAGSFPGDSHISTFVTDVRRQLFAAPSAVGIT
jgi:tetratricopeptide (TPR) repeat protein